MHVYSGSKVSMRTHNGEPNGSYGFGRKSHKPSNNHTIFSSQTFHLAMRNRTCIRYSKDGKG